MATHPLWSDEYWLLLMQLYLKKPEGVKPIYNRQLVALALELHIPPQFLNQQMFRLRTIDTPRIQRLWDTYGQNPKKLARGVKLLRQKKGYGNASLFCCWRSDGRQGFCLLGHRDSGNHFCPHHTDYGLVLLALAADAQL